MNILWEELTAGLTDHDNLLRVFLRLFAAILLGGLIGLQRVNARKPAGLRTHSLVCLGTTVVLLSCSAAGLSLEGASRVIQGIVTGIGFIGAGSMMVLDSPATPRLPISMLLSPVVRLKPALAPNAILLLPVVLLWSALGPLAVLSLPVVLLLLSLNILRVRDCGGRVSHLDYATDYRRSD